MSLPSVGWSNCCEIAMIGGMRRRYFQSRRMNYCCYFAQERVSLSSACKHRSLATRNYLLPSSQGKETLLRVLPQWEQLQAHMVTGIGQERLVPFLAQFARTSKSSFFYSDRRYNPEEGQDRSMRRVLPTQEGEKALQ